MEVSSQNGGSVLGGDAVGGADGGAVGGADAVVPVVNQFVIINLL